MAKNKPIAALPNARIIIDIIGVERVWYELSMQLIKYAQKPAYKRASSRGPYEIQLFKGLEDHFGKGTDARLVYDFTRQEIRGEIMSKGWKISETSIILLEIPKSLSLVITDMEVSQIVNLPHLANRKIIDVRRHSTQKWKLRVYLDDPQARPIKLPWGA